MEPETSAPSALSWKLFALAFVSLSVLGFGAQLLANDAGEGSDVGAPPVVGAGAAAVIDPFLRSDADEPGSAVTGQRWEAVSGTWGIREEQVAVLEPTPRGRSVLLVPLGSSDGSVEATATVMDGTWGLVFRYASPFDFWVIEASPRFATYSVSVVEGGERTVLTPGGTGLAPVADGTRVEVRFVGDIVEVVIDGEVVDVIEHAGPLGTRVGLSFGPSSSLEARWDDFVAEVDDEAGARDGD